MWTRVKAIDRWKSNTVQIFDFDKDIQSDLATARARHHLQNESGKCLFDPDEFAHKGVDYSLSKHSASQEEIAFFVEIATKIRKDFELDRRALQRLVGDKDDAEGLAELQRLTKLKRWHTRLGKQTNQ